MVTALCVAPVRINTIFDIAAVRGYGVSFDGGAEVPTTGGYPLERVRDAYHELNARHTHGKIVLRRSPSTHRDR